MAWSGANWCIVIIERAVRWDSAAALVMEIEVLLTDSLMYGELEKFKSLRGKWT